MLAINEEFTSFQGEGVNTGTKMYFVRLQGCSVGCYFCDTKHTWRPHEATTDEGDIVQRAAETDCLWVCITGGEPLEQDLTKLVHLLHVKGFKIAIETSGMFYHDIIASIDHVTLSPKTLFAKKGMKLNRDTVNKATEIKCVVTKESDADHYMEYFNTMRWGRSLKKFLVPVDNDGKLAEMLLHKDIGSWKVTGQQQKLLQLR